MATDKYLPDYAKVFNVSALGQYGHNILNGGDTSVSGRTYHAIQVLSNCSITYDTAFEVANNSDASGSLSLVAGQTIILGCATNIVVTGGSIIAHLNSITE